jgi:hypothetical protein
MQEKEKQSYEHGTCAAARREEGRGNNINAVKFSSSCRLPLRRLPGIHPKARKMDLAKSEK